MKLEVHVYTFLEEDGEEEKRLAYIINENINLMEITAEQQLNNLLEKIKGLISSKKEEDTKCQID
jgi:predicted transcriptional regulator